MPLGFFSDSLALSSCDTMSAKDAPTVTPPKRQCIDACQTSAVPSDDLSLHAKEVSYSI